MLRSQGLSLIQRNCVCMLLLSPLYPMFYPLGVSVLLQATEELLSRQAITLCRRRPMQNLPHCLNALLPCIK